MDCGFGSSLLLLGTGPGLFLADRTLPTDNGLMCSGRWTRGEFPRKYSFTHVGVVCSDGDQFDGYVEWGLVLSMSDVSLAHASGRLLLVMAVRFVCKWALCCLHGMLCVFCPCFYLIKGCLQKIVWLFMLSFIFYMVHMNSGYSWIVALFVIY